MKLFAILLLTFSATIVVTLGVMKPELLNIGAAKATETETQTESVEVHEMGAAKKNARRRMATQKRNRQSSQTFQEQPDEFDAFMHDFNNQRSSSPRMSIHSGTTTPSSTREQLLDSKAAHDEFMKGFKQGLEKSLRERMKNR